MKTFLIIAILTLSGCSTWLDQVFPDAGCVTYGTHRGDMPPLDLGEISQWVDVLDAGMTGACT